MAERLIARVQAKRDGVPFDEWHFWCPGCSSCHAVNDRWEVTGPVGNPTIAPSVRVIGGDGRGGSQTQCHLFVRDGQIQFLNDCQHALAGQTVPMVPVDDGGWPLEGAKHER